MRYPQNIVCTQRRLIVGSSKLWHPFKGVLRMTKYLEDLGYHVNPKRVRRLLRMMGIMAIYPQKNLSASHPAHKKYPYLLKDLTVNQANMVWCTDLTYIRLNQGFIY